MVSAMCAPLNGYCHPCPLDCCFLQVVTAHGHCFNFALLQVWPHLELQHIPPQVLVDKLVAPGLLPVALQAQVRV